MYQCSDCGRIISSKMHGKCMACRYAEIRRHARAKEKSRIVRLKVDVSKLPKPPREPTLAYRGPSPEDRELKRLYEAAKRQQAMEEAYKNRKRECHPHNRYTPEEDAMLLEMADEGAEVGVIAQAMGRSAAGVKQRLMKLRSEREQK